MSGAWLGRLLRPVRAGNRHLLGARPVLQGLPRTVQLLTPAWSDGGAIPPRHAGRGVGDNVSPALSWRGAPHSAVELVLVMQDPDVPLPRPFTHLCAFGVDPGRGGFPEGGLSPDGARDVLFGRNTAGPPGYAGPRALPGHERHAYHLQLFALRAPSGLTADARLAEVRSVVERLAVARGDLVGTFQQDS